MKTTGRMGKKAVQFSELPYSAGFVSELKWLDFQTKMLALGLCSLCYSVAAY